MAETNTSRVDGMKLTREILYLLADAGGSLIETFVDPYRQLSLSRMFIDEGKIRRFRLRRKLLSMEDQGLISFKENKKEFRVSLQPEGRQRLLKYRVDDIKIARPDIWDRKWRIVLFDVPEEHRTARNAFKHKLDELGFIQLQHSVYVHPYECHNEIELVRVAYNIKQFVKILLVNKIEGEITLRKRFNI